MPEEVEDVDMTTSGILPPGGGQAHDRADAEMHEADDDNARPGNQTENTNTTRENRNDHDNDVDSVDEDAMDLTPDQTPAPQNPSSPPPPPMDSVVPPPPPPAAQTIAALMSERDDGSRSPSVVDAPGGGPSGMADEDDDSSEEDYDGDDDDFVIIPEDHSEPTPEEIKEIESHTETFGNNHEHWDGKLIDHFADDEHSPADTGRIDFPIDHYQGTKESPHKDLLIKSPIVNVGGYDWQIKFYPRGNDSDHLSVYIDCLTVHPKDKEKDKKFKTPVESQESEKKDEKEEDTEKEPPTQAESSVTPPAPVEYQHSVIQLLNGQKVPKRPGVSAHVIVVLYNPTEPRIMVERSCFHRFCPTSTDWGWTRFHGPWYELGQRSRNQRQAMLRDDKLALTAYIRTVKDETGSLWEHSTKENPWDCFSMTGLQGLVGDRGIDKAFVPAIASWLLFKPFRAIITMIKPADLKWEHHSKPKPLITALQRVLFSLRTITRPEDLYRNPIQIREIHQAIPTIPHHKWSVVGIWEVMRNILYEELLDTKFTRSLDHLFGPKRDRETNHPSYKLSLKGVNSVQDAINNSKDVVADQLPVLLHLELDRQEFDQNTRYWKKIMKDIKINESVTVNGQEYTLFGFITHADDLLSNNYATILRPEGPGTCWYQMVDKKNHAEGRDERVVSKLTESQMMKLQGISSNQKLDESNPIASIALYIKEDAVRHAFSSAEMPWTPEPWIKRSLLMNPDSGWPTFVNPPIDIVPADTSKMEEDIKEPEKPKMTYRVRAISSKSLLEDVPGIKLLELFGKGYERMVAKGLVHQFDVNEDVTSIEMKNQIASLTKDDAEHIVCWPMTMPSTWIASMSPWNLMNHPSGGKFFGEVSLDKPAELSVAEKWVFFHVHTEEEEKLRKELAEDARRELERQQRRDDRVEPVPAIAPTENSTEAIPPPPPPAAAAEDTVMSEAEESPIEPPPPSNTTTRERIRGGVPPPRRSNSIPPRRTFDLAQQLTDAESGWDSGSGIPPPMPSAEARRTLQAASASMTAPGIFGSGPPPTLAQAIAANTASSGDSGSGAEASGSGSGGPPPPGPPGTVQATVQAIDNQHLVIEYTTASGSPVTAVIPPSILQDRQQQLALAQAQAQAQAQAAAAAASITARGIYFVLKTWDPDTQKLKNAGFFLAKHSTRVDHAVQKILRCGKEPPLTIYCQRTLLHLETLRRKRDFNATNLALGAVIIVQRGSPKNTKTLRMQGGFVDLDKYLVAQMKDLLWPERRNTNSRDITLDYFGGELYTGPLLGHLAHGSGRRIYTTGDEYTGGFALGLRHGSGKMVFRNGDTYDGEWSEDMQEGNGKYVDGRSGNVYEGGWLANRKHGEGVTHWKRAEEAEKVCKVCFENGAEAAFYDCGHVVACMTCAKRLDVCPICRKRVVSAIKLFYSF